MSGPLPDARERESDPFPEAVGAFVDRCLPTVADLDVLLWLARSPERRVTARSVANEMGMQVLRADECIRGLERVGLVEHVGGWGREPAWILASRSDADWAVTWLARNSGRYRAEIIARLASRRGVDRDAGVGAPAARGSAHPSSEGGRPAAP